MLFHPVIAKCRISTECVKMVCVFSVWIHIDVKIATDTKMERGSSRSATVFYLQNRTQCLCNSVKLHITLPSHTWYRMDTEHRQLLLCPAWQTDNHRPLHTSSSESCISEIHPDTASLRNILCCHGKWDLCQLHSFCIYSFLEMLIDAIATCGYALLRVAMLFSSFALRSNSSQLHASRIHCFSSRLDANLRHATANHL